MFNEKKVLYCQSMFIDFSEGVHIFFTLVTNEIIPARRSSPGSILVGEALVGRFEFLVRS